MRDTAEKSAAVGAVGTMEREQRFDEDSAAYRAGNAALTHTRMQERIERARLGLPDLPSEEESGQEGETEPIPLTLQSFDPRATDDEPEAEPYRVEPMSADWMLEVWYLYLTAGPLASAKMLSATGAGVGVNEALAATLYVQDTPGFNRAIVLYAQTHRGEHDLWARWFGAWPDNRALAQTIYETFRAALAQRLRIQPFRVLTTPIYTPDHLEQADAANGRDLVERNREWARRRREDLTRSVTDAA